MFGRGKKETTVSFDEYKSVWEKLNEELLGQIEIRDYYLSLKDQDQRSNEDIQKKIEQCYKDTKNRVAVIMGYGNDLLDFKEREAKINLIYSIGQELKEVIEKMENSQRGPTQSQRKHAETLIEILKNLHKIYTSNKSQED